MMGRRFGVWIAMPVVVALLAAAAAFAEEGEGEGGSSAEGAGNLGVLREIFSGAGVGGGGGGGRGGRANVNDIKKLLASERNVKVTEMGGRIFLDGQVTSDQMRKRVDTLLGVYENVVDLTEFQPSEDTLLADMDLIKERIEDKLNRDFDGRTSFTPKQTIDVEIVNDKIVISGEVNNPQDVEQSVRLAKIFNSDVVNNLTVRRQMIEIAAIFAKVQKKAGDKLGTTGMQSAIFQIPGLVAAAPEGTNPANFPLFGGGDNSNYFRRFRWSATGASAGTNLQGATEADNLMKIDFLTRFEKSVVLVRPHLSTLNGQNAEFLAGGEKAIKTTTANTSDVTYKQFGVILNITPVLTTNGLIQLTISLEFSVPAANGEDFITFIHKGEALLGRDQGLALSGLINEARSRGVDRTPYVSRVPILNFFFGKKTQNKDGEELVLMVLPKLPRVVRQAPYVSSDRTGKVAEDAMWIHKPSLPKRMARAITEGEKDEDEPEEYWVEKEVIQEPSETEQELDQMLNDIADVPGKPLTSADIMAEQEAAGTVPAAGESTDVVAPAE